VTEADRVRPEREAADGEEVEVAGQLVVEADHSGWAARCPDFEPLLTPNVWVDTTITALRSGCAVDSRCS
jgi:hypothetical protein